MASVKLIIDKEMCKGCELCISVCPEEVLVMSKKINKLGMPYPQFQKKELCTACKFCAIICPDCAIRIFKLEKVSTTDE